MLACELFHASCPFTDCGLAVFSAQFIYAVYMLTITFAMFVSKWVQSVRIGRS